MDFLKNFGVSPGTNFLTLRGNYGKLSRNPLSSNMKIDLSKYLDDWYKEDPAKNIYPGPVITIWLLPLTMTIKSVNAGE